ncbi:MAG: hypothetical protein CMJ64_09745 [Planctomycetaceae bacterium]|nr:hypothetical protein [Planctomycetaceae bacterium]
MGDASGVPDGVNSIMEIIINGRDLEAVKEATHAAIDNCIDTPGLVKISAGNYRGRLGKSFIYLRHRPKLSRRDSLATAHPQRRVRTVVIHVDVGLSRV